jgi:hypothetical protein
MKYPEKLWNVNQRVEGVLARGLDFNERMSGE